MIGDQASRVGAVAPGVPTQWPLAFCDLFKHDGGSLHMLALGRFIYALVMQPAQAMRGDFVLLFKQGCGEFGVTF